MKKFLVAIAIFAAFLISAGPVDAVSFNFSFTNEFPLGGVDGTVTGRIDGLADTGTSAATGVFITSSPAALEYPLSASDNILAQPLTFLINSFTLTNGELTAVDFNSNFPIANTEEFFSLHLTLGCCSHANRVGPTRNLLVESTSTTFEPVSQVPLPTALPLFATGLGALGLLGYRKKKKPALAVRRRADAAGAASANAEETTALQMQ